MEKILEWLRKYKETPSPEYKKPLVNFNLKELLTEWDYDYIMRIYDGDINGFLNFINLVDFLHIQKLLDLS